MSDERWFVQFYDYRGSTTDQVITGPARRNAARYLNENFTCHAEPAPNSAYHTGCLFVVQVFDRNQLAAIKSYVEETLGFYLKSEEPRSPSQYVWDTSLTWCTTSSERCILLKFGPQALLFLLK